MQYTLPADIIISEYKISAKYEPNAERKFSPPEGYPIYLGGSGGFFKVTSPHNCSDGQYWSGSACITAIEG